MTSTRALRRRSCNIKEMIASPIPKVKSRPLERVPVALNRSLTDNSGDHGAVNLSEGRSTPSALYDV